MAMKQPLIAKSVMTILALFSMHAIAGSNHDESHHEESHHEESHHEESHHEESHHEESHHEESHSSQGAHVHGIATLDIAKDGSVVELQFESPAANIVGFEYSAVTKEQKAAVVSAKKILESPAKLFKFSDIACKLNDSKVDVSSVEPSHAKVEHKHEHDHAQESHNVVSANYQFSCQQDEKLSSLMVYLHQHFAAIEKLHVQWITDTKQGSLQLTPQSTSVNFR